MKAPEGDDAVAEAFAALDAGTETYAGPIARSNRTQPTSSFAYTRLPSHVPQYFRPAAGRCSSSFTRASSFPQRFVIASATPGVCHSSAPSAITRSIKRVARERRGGDRRHRRRALRRRSAQA